MMTNLLGGLLGGGLDLLNGLLGAFGSGHGYVFLGGIAVNKKDVSG